MAAPEARSAGPEAHYAADAQRYAACRVTQRVQQELTARALELLGPPAAQPLLLDLGCGSGNGHDLLAAAGWGVLGCDISADMLQQPAPTPAAAAFDRVRLDMGQGLPLRREVLPAAISISAVQWVCKAGPGPMRRLLTSLHACLQPGARAVLQLYPQTRQQVAELLEACHVSGLQAVFLMDLPHQTAAGKFFLVLHKPNTAAGGCLLAHTPPSCPLSLRLGGGCVLGWHILMFGAAMPPVPSSCDTWLLEQHRRHLRKLQRLLWHAAAHAQLLQPLLGVGTAQQAGSDASCSSTPGACTSSAATGGQGITQDPTGHWLREVCLVGGVPSSCCGEACLSVLAALPAPACQAPGSMAGASACGHLQAAGSGASQGAAATCRTQLQLLSTEVLSTQQLESELWQRHAHATVCKSRHSCAGSSSYKGPRLEACVPGPVPACVAGALAQAGVAGSNCGAYWLKAPQFAEYLVVVVHLQHGSKAALWKDTSKADDMVLHDGPSLVLPSLASALVGSPPADRVTDPCWQHDGCAPGMQEALSTMHCLQQLPGRSVHATFFVQAPDAGLLLVALWPVGDQGSDSVAQELGDRLQGCEAA